MNQFVAKSLPPNDRDDHRGAYSPPETAPVDFFLGVSHDLFAIGALHRAQAQAFNDCLLACQKRYPSALSHAISKVHTNAVSIASLTKALQSKLDAHGSDNYEASNQVYGSVK